MKKRDGLLSNVFSDADREEMEQALGFLPSPKRLAAEERERQAIPADIIPYGVPFLDAITGGILPGELVLLGGSTGTGKTEIATEIAIKAAMDGRRVYFFALEADTNEIERRMIFKLVSNKAKASGVRVTYDYKSWLLGEAKEYMAHEPWAQSEIYKLSNLHTFYKDGTFTLSDFETMFLTLDERADLVIVDHIHYFDLVERDELKEMSKIIHYIRKLTQVLGIPVLLLAHLRKLEQGATAPLIPSNADFKGTGSLTNVSTTTILLGRDATASYAGKEAPTFIKVDKSRTGGGRISVACKTMFDTSRNAYAKDYVTGVFSADRTEFYAFEDNQKPYWLQQRK